VTDRRGKRRSNLCYVHKQTETTEILGDHAVLPWTNPVAQIGLTYNAGRVGTVIDESGAVAQRVEPVTRGEFDQVLPTLSGTYVPGGDFPVKAAVRMSRTTLLRGVRKPARAFTGSDTDANRAAALPLVLKDAAALAKEDAATSKSMRDLRSLFIALTARTPTYNDKLVRLAEVFRTSEDREPIATAYADAYEAADASKMQQGAEFLLSAASDARERSGPLKSVKLGMTLQQVEAFIDQPAGYMLVQGAPGTGKTTVALQRIRFLMDLDRNVYQTAISHTVASTIVFVPNPTFLNHVGDLLESELRLPADLVTTPDAYVQTYLRSTWLDRHGAVVGTFGSELLRAREAYFGLCEARELRGLWHAYELQIRARLASFSETFDATRYAVSHGSQRNLIDLGANLDLDVELSSDPHDSQLRMDQVSKRSKRHYSALLDSMSSLSDDLRSEFERAFRHWLYWVYDPLDAIGVHFSSTHEEGVDRIDCSIRDAYKAAELGALIGTWLREVVSSRPSPFQVEIASQGDESQSLGARRREYGTAERPWIAWLLRNALPEQPGTANRFARLPSCYVNPRAGVSAPWHHIVIDEAQDLTVAEAAFLSSLVHQRGALTVSADFRQAVAPGRGIDSDESLVFGSAMRANVNANENVVHEFKVNLRQAGPIGRFVKAYYNAAFGERAAFEASAEPGRKPVLVIETRTRMVQVMQKIIDQLRSEAKTIAIIGVDYEERETRALHRQLEPFGARLFHEYLDSSDRSGVIVASAQEVKGHEFDACLIRGLENLQRSPMNHSKNRGYVALSRAMRRLVILADERPPIMDLIGRSLYITQDLIERRRRGQ
jgi:hypothetical protein